MKISLKGDNYKFTFNNHSLIGVLDDYMGEVEVRIVLDVIDMKTESLLKAEDDLRCFTAMLMLLEKDFPDIAFSKMAIPIGNLFVLGIHFNNKEWTQIYEKYKNEEINV